MPTKKLGRFHSERTGRAGVHAVGSIFLEDFEWFFRPQDISDIGIDAHVDILDNDEPTGKLFAVQIKSGSSWFRKSRGEYIYHISQKHFKYWNSQVIPVYVILADTRKKIFIWERIEPHKCKPTGRGWSIAIPSANLLDVSSKSSFESFTSTSPTALRRQEFHNDLELMQTIHEQHPKTTLLLCEQDSDPPYVWRKMAVYAGGDRRQSPDVVFSLDRYGFDLSELMAVLFPWCSYKVADVKTTAKKKTHKLHIELLPVAVSFLEVETFFGEDLKHEKG